MAKLPAELAELQDKEFVLPAYRERSLVNLAATVLELFGGRAPHPPLPRGLLPELDGVRRVVLLVVDSLGWERFLPLLEDKSLIFRRLAQEGKLAQLTSVFPSTTTSALATLASALAPEEHGLLGYRLYLRELGLVANMLRLSPEGLRRPDTLLEMGLSLRRLFTFRTIYERLAPRGVRSLALIRVIFRGSGFSRLLYRGAEEVPFAASSDMCVRLRKLLELYPEERLLIGAYWDAVDTIGHLWGPAQEELEAEVRQLAYSLEREFFARLSPKAARGTLVLICADHGQVEVRPEEAFRITRYPKLRRSLLLPPTGDFRASYLHLRQGELGPIKRYLQGRRFQEKLVVVESSEALAGGLFGPEGAMPEGFLPRIGDLLLLARSRGFIFYPYEGPLLRGYHGGLSREEMLVPLLALRLG